MKGTKLLFLVFYYKIYLPDTVIFAQGQNEVAVTAFSESMVLLQLCLCFLGAFKMLAEFSPDHC